MLTTALKFISCPSRISIFTGHAHKKNVSVGELYHQQAIQLAKQYPQYRYLLETEVFVSNFVDSHQGTKELEDFKNLVKQDASRLRHCGRRSIRIRLVVRLWCAT